MKEKTLLVVLLLLVSFSSPGVTVAAPASYALSFDGGDRVIIADTPSLNPSQITVETWVKFNRLAYGGGYTGTDAQFLISKGGDRTGGVYRLGQGGASSSQHSIWFAIGPYWDERGVSMPHRTMETNRWYHVAGTYDGNTLKIYVDGILEGSSDVGSLTVGNTSPLYFSFNDVGGFPYYLDGAMDEIRIWNVARTQYEIQADMYRSLVGDEPGLVGYWRLDEGTGQVAGDSTANSNTGQLGSTSDVDADDPTWVVSDVPAGPGVTVRAQAPTAAPELTFSIAPGIAPEGGSVTGSSIDFGALAASTPKTGSQRLSVSTNAANGYNVTTEEDHPLQSGANTIPDVIGDDPIVPITEVVAGPWSLATTYGFGYSLANVSGTDATFTAGHKQFPDGSSGEPAEAVMSNAGPVTNSQTDVTYKLNIGPSQPAGTYQNTITYIATGNF